MLFILAIALFGLLVATSLRIHGLLGNELESFIYTKHWLDPTFIRNDWRLDQSPGPRVPFMAVLTPLLMFLRVEQAVIVGMLLGFALVSIAAALFFLRIRLSLIEGVVVVAAHLALGQSLAADEWLFGPFESKVVAYVCVLTALSTGSTMLVGAGALLGFATTMHPLVGGWSTLFFAAAAWGTQVGTASQRWRAIAAWLLFASPGIVATLISFEGTATALGDGITPEWIYVRFRDAHHLDAVYFLSSMVKRSRVGLAILGALFCFALPRFVNRGDPLLLIGRFFQAAMVPFVAGVVLSFVPGAELFLQLYPFRVADGLGILLLLSMALALTKAHLQSRKSRIVFRLIVVAVGLAVAVTLPDPPRHGETPPPGFNEIARWVKAHTPPDEPVLVSPRMTFAGYWLERPVVVLFKFPPHRGRAVSEWYERIIDFCGGARPNQRSSDASREVHERFMSMSAQAYQLLGTKYGARYLVRPERPDLPFAVAHTSAGWAVYHLDGS